MFGPYEQTGSKKKKKDIARKLLALRLLSINREMST